MVLLVVAQVMTLTPKLQVFWAAILRLMVQMRQGDDDLHESSVNFVGSRVAEKGTRIRVVSTTRLRDDDPIISGAKNDGQVVEAALLTLVSAHVSYGRAKLPPIRRIAVSVLGFNRHGAFP